MKFDIKQSFLGLVISLVIVILFSSYLGIYMKEGFEDDVPPEDLGDFVPDDVEYGEFVAEEAPKVDPAQTAASMQSYEEYQKSMKEQEEKNKAFEAAAAADFASAADEEAAEEAAYEAEKKKAAETIAAMQAAIKAGSSSRDDIKKQLTEYIAKSQAELAALKSKSDANQSKMGNLDFIPSSERGSFAKQDMVTGFFNTTDQKIQSAKNLAAQANSSAEVAKSRAMAALNKANQAPEAPDLSGYATKQQFGQMNQRLGGLDKKLGGFATKADLNPFATKAEIGNLATKAQLGGYATQADLNEKVQSAGKGNYATQEQLNNLRNEFNSKFLKHGDEITLRSRKTGRRLQDRGWGRFANHNRMWWERFHIEKCGQPGMYDNRQCR